MATTHARRIMPANGVQTTADAVAQMSDGNPGALNVMLGLLRYAESTKLKHYESGVVYLMDLDELGLYGPNIWLAYKDVCGEDMAELARVLREDRDVLRQRVAEAGGTFE